MKKVLVSIFLASLIAILSSGKVAAQSTCTQVYGGGVVCGAVAPTPVPHQPVNTGIGDNLALLGGLLSMGSASLVIISRKIASRTSVIK